MTLPDRAHGLHRGLLVMAVFAIGAGGTSAAEKIELQPHRIAYEVSLGPKTGALASANGLMALEFTGNACDGYATNFRQVTTLVNSDGQPNPLDFRVNLWESGDGASLRFTTRNQVGSRVTRDAEGEAKRNADGSMSVAMKRPAGKKGDFDGNILFPSMLTKAIVETVARGERRHNARLFDGSESGDKVYEVSSSIGSALVGERNARVEDVLKGNALDSVSRWPVSMAYYDETPGDRVPVYTMRSVTFANGVLSDIIFEFPEFSLRARATRYEPISGEPCKR